MKTTVHVTVPNHTYDIYIGSNLLTEISLITPYIRGKQIAIVTDKLVANHYLLTLQKALNNLNYQMLPIIINQGEINKNQATVDYIYQQLLENNFSRDCMIIALGGGIVGDITGFAAASYHRGVDFIQIPTTLLAQVDSSVGGKTGINHPMGKNLIGAFNQPKTVIIDTQILSTLDSRQLSAGLSEVIKYGLIRDNAFLDYLKTNISEVFKLNPLVLNHIIKISCQHKSDIVQADEKENSIRATLNLGHTFGHAIESLTHYKEYLHGEAISIGMMMALDLSKNLGWIDEVSVNKAEQLFKLANCPTQLPKSLNINASTLRLAMQRDKKVNQNKLKLILCQPIGHAVICDDINEEMISNTISQRII